MILATPASHVLMQFHLGRPDGNDIGAVFHGEAEPSAASVAVAPADK